jgi:hypothetical protein
VSTDGDKGSGLRTHRNGSQTPREGTAPSLEHLARGLPPQETPRRGGKQSPATRQLNPRFVEWLMGWPAGWSDPFDGTGSGCSGTGSCLPQPLSPSANSLRASESDL